MTSAATFGLDAACSNAYMRGVIWFYLRPAAYAHQDWWTEEMRTLLRPAGLRPDEFSRVDAHDCAAVTAASNEWLAHQNEVDPCSSHWLLRSNVEKLFAAPPSFFNKAVTQVGLSMHRTALLGLLNGRTLRAVRECFGGEQIDTVLSHSKTITNVLPRAFACIPERRFESILASENNSYKDFIELIEFDGARTLLEAVAVRPTEFVKRAKLRWPRAWSRARFQLSSNESVELNELLGGYVLQPFFKGHSWLS